MKILAVVLLIANLSLACGPHPDGADSNLLQMFANATRREASNDEAAQVVAMIPHCAAFFVANRRGTSLLISARHCAFDDARRWCQESGQLITNTGVRGRCLEVLATDERHDIFLFRSNLPYPGRSALRLAVHAPKTGSALKMIGYPLDVDLGTHKGRQGRLTVTENCWVLGNNYRGPHERNSPHRSFDLTALHNCSTYGGNSGGPMLLAGTDVVVGLPTTYWPWDFVLRTPHLLQTAGNMAQISDFVRHYIEVLKKEEVAMVDNPSDAENRIKPNPTSGVPPFTFFKNYACNSEGRGDAIFFTVVYNVANRLTSYLVSYGGSPLEEAAVHSPSQPNVVSLRSKDGRYHYIFDFSRGAENIVSAEVAPAGHATQKVTLSCSPY